jgi:hypothetical protein
MSLIVRKDAKNDCKNHLRKSSDDYFKPKNDLRESLNDYFKPKNDL